MTPPDASEMQQHHVVISADCHAGAAIRDYKPYLEQKYHARFDEWASSIEAAHIEMSSRMGDESVLNVGVGGDPVADANRNWDLERRMKEQHEDGVVAEVVFPNTQPPFAPIPSTMFEAPALVFDDPELRFAGLRAHNRWAADFVAEAPAQRSAVVQVFLGDVEGSVRELEWARDNGLRGGMLLPGAPPGSGFEPLYSPSYEPLWAACADLDYTVTHHSGGGTPDFGPYYPSSMAMFMLEVTWWGHRAMWHLMFSGVFERYPNLRFVNTETGTKWIVDTLDELDTFYERMKVANHGSEALFGRVATRDLSMKPSEYWRRQCAIGASFLRPMESALRHQVGVDNIMWGSDYPHLEATTPYTRQALRLTFGGVDPAETTKMLTTNAARFYHFDVAELQALADEWCPTKGEVFEKLDFSTVPEDASKCPGLAPHTQWDR